MRVMRAFFWSLGITVVVGIFARVIAANEAKSPEFRLAAAFQLPQLPGLSGPAADWRQWDAFFTFVVNNSARS